MQTVHACARDKNTTQKVRQVVRTDQGVKVALFAALKTPIPAFSLCITLCLGIDGLIILGWISRRWDVGVWTGLGWPRIETGGGRL